MLASLQAEAPVSLLRAAISRNRMSVSMALIAGVTVSVRRGRGGGRTWCARLALGGREGRIPRMRDDLAWACAAPGCSAPPPLA